MFKRLLPYLIILFLVMIDVSVVPVFTTSVYVVPVTLVFVMCQGMLLGRTHGMLGGLLGGLLIDIIAGTPLGYMTFAYIACGYVTGLIGYDSGEDRKKEGYSRRRARLRRALTVAGMLLLLEGVTLAYQYFNTALYAPAYAYRALARVLIGATLTSALFYPLSYIIVEEEKKPSAYPGSKREVKNL